MGRLRRLIAISLLAMLGLQFVPPLLALTARSESNLPACCRRNGKHHCMMSISERGRLASRDPQFAAPAEKCPYSPAAVVASHGDTFAQPLVQAIFAGVVAHPAATAQTESKLRISLNRSRQKRGPPASFFL
jgi:hypothetical protein